MWLQIGSNKCPEYPINSCSEAFYHLKKTVGDHMFIYKRWYRTSKYIIGIDTKKHDIRFVEDDWESPTLGAAGLGWEVWCDGMEVTQFTYFQQMTGIECKPVPVELTYGLERLCMFVQGKKNVYDLDWNNEGVKYKEVFFQAEKEFSAYNFEHANTETLLKSFEFAESECQALLEKKSKNGGRNNNGRITVRHQGGGHKQHYRIIDFKRNKFDVPAVVETIEYDPNRSAHLALLKYADGERRYIIAPGKIKVGDPVLSADQTEMTPGNCMKLLNIPLGTPIHCVEMNPNFSCSFHCRRCDSVWTSTTNLS